MKNYRTFNKENDVRLIDEKSLSKGFLKVKEQRLQYRLFSDDWSSVVTREVLKTKPVVAAILFDPIVDKIVLIQQFRTGALHASNPWLLEIVAGMKDEEDHSLEDVIKREIHEESGLIPGRLLKLFEYWVSPGISDEYVTLYCAEVNTKNAGGIHGLIDDSEDIFVYTLSCDEAFKLLADGKLQNALTIIGLQWLQLNKNSLKERWEGN